MAVCLNFKALQEKLYLLVIFNISINVRRLAGKSSCSTSLLRRLLRVEDPDETTFFLFEIDFVKPAAKVHFLAHEA